MDLEMPVLDGIEATRAILAELPGDGRARADLVLRSPADHGRARRRRGRLPAQGRIGRRGRAGHPRRRRRAARRSIRGPHGRCSRRRAHPTRSPGSRRASARCSRCWSRAAEQADRPAAGDQREDGQVAPDEHLPRDRRDRPRPGGAVGRAPGAAERPRRRSRWRPRSRCGCGRLAAHTGVHDPDRRPLSRCCSATASSCSSPLGLRGSREGRRWRGPRRRYRAAAARRRS